MYGYIVTLKGLPEPKWACETKVTNYYWENSHSDNLMELSIVTAEYIIKTVKETDYVYENVRGMSCTVADKNLKAKSKPGIPVSVITVAARFQEIKITAKELTAEDCNDENRLILPAFTQEINDDELDEINILLRKYIRHNERNSEFDKITCYSIFYSILAKLDSYMRKYLNSNINNNYNYYVKKANWIIHERYNTKLTEPDIATELGISSGYLSSIYKSTTNKTIGEYLLMYRMRKAEELLQNDNMTTSQIALAVGFNDENYFRKKFKQYFGMNMKEYRNIKRGNTLYHDKPIKKQ